MNEDQHMTFSCDVCLHKAVIANIVIQAKRCFQTSTVSANSLLDEKTTLFHAIQNGNLEMVLLLLKHKADVNQLSSFQTDTNDDVDMYDHDDPNTFSLGIQRESAILTATRLRKKAILDALFEHGNFVPGVHKHLPQKKAMSVAIGNNDVEIAQVLVKHGCDVQNVSKKHKTGLHKAAHFGHAQMIDFLLKNGGKITRDNGGVTPLHIAAQFGHFEALESLLRYCHGTFLPCMEDFSGMSPMAYACTKGHLPVIGTLMAFAHEAHGKCIFTSAKPLYQAVFHGHHHIVKYFINTRVHINSLHKGESPLCAAVKGKHIEIVKLLIENKAKIDLVGANGITPLQAGILVKSYDALMLLIRHGADVNTPVNKKGTLHVRTKEIARFLLDSGFCPKKRAPSPKMGLLKISIKDPMFEEEYQKPRTLQEICRFKVRDTLRKATGGSSIVSLTRKIVIPNIIRDFILMCDVTINKPGDEA